MRRKSLEAVLSVASLAVAAAVMPSSAAAQTCIPGANQSTCQALTECYAIGATIFVTASPAEAVGWARNCLNLDRRYRIEITGSGNDARQRARPKRTTRSTFWSLYCEAERRAGNPNAPLCRIRSAPSGSGGGGGGGGRTDGGSGGGTREPNFTG